MSFQGVSRYCTHDLCNKNVELNYVTFSDFCNASIPSLAHVVPAFKLWREVIYLEIWNYCKISASQTSCFIKGVCAIILHQSLNRNGIFFCMISFNCVYYIPFVKSIHNNTNFLNQAATSNKSNLHTNVALNFQKKSWMLWIITDFTSK